MEEFIKNYKSDRRWQKATLIGVGISVALIVVKFYILGG